MGANVLVSRKLFAVFGSGIGRKSENFGGRFHRDDARGATINLWR